MISVTAMSVSIAWLRLRSGSLWTATIYHAAHNVAVQGIFDGSTIDTGVTKWITTEFGIGLVITSVAFRLFLALALGTLMSRADAPVTARQDPGHRTCFGEW